METETDTRGLRFGEGGSGGAGIRSIGVFVWRSTCVRIGAVDGGLRVGPSQGFRAAEFGSLWCVIGCWRLRCDGLVSAGVRLGREESGRLLGVSGMLMGAE